MRTPHSSIPPQAGLAYGPPEADYFAVDLMGFDEVITVEVQNLGFYRGERAASAAHF